MPSPHPFSGLFAGDHFIHRMKLDGTALFAYGLVRSIDSAGRYDNYYQAQLHPTAEQTVDAADHRVVGRISRRAYELARLRGWPNDELGVAAIVAYSSGEKTSLSLKERIRMLFVS